MASTDTSFGASAAGGRSYDEIAAFDLAVGGDMRDPYPFLAVGRQATPVLRMEPEQVAELNLDVLHTIGPAFGTRPVFMCFKRKDVINVLRQPALFDSSHMLEVMGPVMGRALVVVDGEEHARARRLVAPAFREKVLLRWREEIIRPVVNELIDGFAGAGRAELRAQLMLDFPVQVIARILGLPRPDYAQFRRWATQLITFSAGGEFRTRGIEASQRLREYLTGLMEERRARPGDDLMSELIAAQSESDRLTEEEILSYLLLLLPAGAETTFRATGNLVMALLLHPTQLQLVASDRSLVPAAVEEALRWEPPLLFDARTARVDTEIDGVPVQAGDFVVVGMGSANRDEDFYEDPDRFDIQRAQEHQLLSFAVGPHMCLGIHLARLEMVTALEVLLDRLPAMRLDPEADDPHIHGLSFRSPTSIPVLFG